MNRAGDHRWQLPADDMQWTVQRRASFAAPRRFILIHCARRKELPEWRSLVAGWMRKIVLAVAAAAIMLPMPASAKGEGVGLWMEGTVSNVEVNGKDIRLVLTGRIAEASLVLWLQGLTIGEYLASRDPVAGSVYLIMLGVFAIMPILVARR